MRWKITMAALLAALMLAAAVPAFGHAPETKGARHSLVATGGDGSDLDAGTYWRCRAEISAITGITVATATCDRFDGEDWQEVDGFADYRRGGGIQGYVGLYDLRPEDWQRSYSDGRWIWGWKDN